MIKEIDKRNLLAYKRDEPRRDFAGFASPPSDPNSLTSVSQISGWTGNPRNIKIDNSSISNENLIDQAINFAQSYKETSGFAAEEPAEYCPDPIVKETSAGTSIVHLHQVYKGVPVFLASKTIIFSGAGRKREGVIKGETVNIPPGTEINAKIGAKKALEIAIQFFNDENNQSNEIISGWGGNIKQEIIDIPDIRIKKIVEFNTLPSMPTVFDKGMLEEYIPAHLVMFFMSPNVRLGWKFIINLGAGIGKYEIIISADEEEAEVNDILYCKLLSLSAVGLGKVFIYNGDVKPIEKEFPLNVKEYPICHNGRIRNFPDWIENNETKGVNVISCNEQGKSLKGKLINDIVTFQVDPNDLESVCILNLFYYCNYLHNFFYLLGFDERSGDFQNEDPVVVKFHNYEIPRIAEFLPRVDGTSPDINFGLYSNSGRHTALDADVIIHEYVHGVSTRLVGSPNDADALVGEQSKALGEGWSDYFALTIQNYYLPNEKNIIGNWTINSSKGIRRHPYDNKYHSYRTYGTLSSEDPKKVHDNGEVWCAALMHWTRHLSQELNKERAHCICWQAIVDGMKATNARPCYLDARDAILSALDDMYYNENLSNTEYTHAINKFWDAFALLGMGVNAISNGDILSGIVESFEKPAPKPLV